MQYYDSAGKLVNFNLNSKINNGKSSEIYQLDGNECFKKYFEYSTSDVKMDFNVFDILKSLNHSHINQILELYYDVHKIKNRYKLIEYCINYTIDGYKYLYIKEESNNIIKQSTEYMLYNFIELEKLINILTDFKIRVEDLKRENTIYSNDKIILIDLDLCRIEKNTEYSELHKYNIEQLSSLFIDLFMKCKSYGYQYEDEVIDLFSITDYDNYTSNISKKIMKYKTPLDYIKSC